MSSSCISWLPSSDRIFDFDRSDPRTRWRNQFEIDACKSNMDVTIHVSGEAKWTFQKSIRPIRGTVGLEAQAYGHRLIRR